MYRPPESCPPRIIAPVVVLLLVAATAGAGLQVSPVRSLLSVPPGGHGSQVLTVVNTGDGPLRVTPSLHDWTVTGGTTDGLALHPPGTRPRSCSPWVEVWPEQAEVAPGESAELRVSVALPDDAEGSYFSAVVLAGGLQPARLGSMDVGVAVNVVHLVTVHTAGRTTWSAETPGLELSRPDDTGSLEIRLELRNTGSGAIRPQGSFAIVDETGALAGRVDLSTYCAQPGGVARVRETWDGLLAPGSYQVIGTVELGGGVVLTPEAGLEVRDQVAVESLSADGAGGGVRVALRLVNPGNLTHELSGRLELQGPDGAILRSLEQGPLLVLSGGSAERTVELGPAEPGAYRVALTMADDTVHLEAATEVVVR